MTNALITQHRRANVQSAARRPGRRRPPRRLLLAAPALALALVLAACGGGSTATASDSPASIRITAPADGATVGRQFAVKLDPSVPIGEPSTGRHHVHLYYDGNRSANQADYDIAYTTSFTVTRLADGKHTIEAVIANADHSVTDAHTQLTVMVSGSGDGGAPLTTSSGGVGGY